MWMVFANAKKRKGRLLMTVAGIAIGVATLFALLAASEGIRLGLEREIGGLGAHVLLLPVGCPYTLTLALMQGADTLDYIPGDQLPAVLETENVAQAIPVVVGRARVNGEMVPLYGATEDIVELKRWTGVQLGGAVVGSDVATQLGLRAGDEVEIALYTRQKIQVGAVLPRTGGRDDTFVFLPLPVAQNVLGLQEEFSAVLVRTENLDRVTHTRQILGRIPHLQAIPPSEVFDMLVALFGSVSSTLMLITGIAIVVGVLTTMNTMTMAVYERRNEIGLLRALGATRGNVFRLFVTESLWVSVIGGLLGVALGYVATRFLPATTGFGVGVEPHFSGLYVIVCLVVAAAVGTLAGMYPAMMAARLQPISALRQP